MSDKPSFVAEPQTAQCLYAWTTPMTASLFPICGHVGNGTRFRTIRGFKKSWPVRRAFGRGLIASLSGRKFERRTLHLCHAASVESVRRAGSKQLASNRTGAFIFGRVGVAGYNDVNRVRHVRLR